jgi:hypothetical protein
MSVANIGEQLPNADAKVFEVVIRLDESDNILRPSMTTANKIITKTINDVTYIPLESVQNTLDSVPFVYLKSGVKQIVVLGESNENNVIVEKGLEPETQIYLNLPEEPERFTRMAGEELIAEIKEREKAKREAERRANEEAKRNYSGEGMMGMPPGMGEGEFRGGGMRGNFPGGGQDGNIDTAAMRRFNQMRQQMQPEGQPGMQPGGQRGARNNMGGQRNFNPDMQE